MIFNKIYPGVDNAIQSHFCGSAKNGIGELHLVIRGSENLGHSKNLLKTIVPSVHIFFATESKLSIPERIQNAVAAINATCIAEQAKNTKMKNFTFTLALALIEHDGKGWFASIGKCQILVSIDDNIFQVNSPTQDIESETAVDRKGNLVIPSRSFIEGIGHEKSLDYLTIHEPVQLRKDDLVILSTRNIYNYYSQEEVNSLFQNSNPNSAIEIIVEKIKDIDVINGVALSMHIQEEISEVKSPMSNQEIVHDNTGKKLFFRNENEPKFDPTNIHRGVHSEAPLIKNEFKRPAPNQSPPNKNPVGINPKVIVLFIVILAVFIICLFL
jgi:hypothetical protein